MILFKKDWLDFPTAIVDYDTTNTSFLRLVYLYKKMGVDNAEFILALMQPELVGVDPFSEDLTEEQQMMIAKEAMYNPWYYFRELCRIRPNAGSAPRRFEANRANIALYWCFFNHIDIGLVMIRQTGKTVGTIALMNGIINIWARNTTTYLLTKDTPLRGQTVETLKEMRNLLPKYIYYPNRLDSDNSELVTNVRHNNRYKTAVGRNDRVAADKLGRGLTSPIMHGDEVPYISMIGTTLPVALSSGSAARDEAAAAGQYYGNIFTTTAGDMTSRDGKYAYEFMTSGVNWSEKFFDLLDQSQLERVVDTQSTGLKPIVYAAFNHRQIGKSDEWLYRKMREANASGEVADRDYMGIWTTGSQESPIHKDHKKNIKDSEREPDYIQITEDNYIFRWYIPEEEIEERLANSHFVLGNDPSETLGEKSDGTGLVLLDAYTHDIVATGCFNESSTTRISEFIAKLLIDYPTITFIPERKSMGIAILDHLFIILPKAGIDPFKRIYNRIVDEPELNATAYREIQKSSPSSRPSYFYDRYKKYFGYNTSGSGRHARENLYGEVLNNAVKLGGHRMYDTRLIGELLSLTVRNGRIDHESGKHDDMVISLLLAHWFCTKTQNLAFYGIDSRRVFSMALRNDKATSLDEQYHNHQQKKQLEQFHDVMRQLNEELDPVVISQLEAKLRSISSRVDVDESAGVGIDAMIQQAKEERLRRQRTKRHRSPYHRPHRRFGGM